MMNLLQLHWGFLVGGGSRYVRMLERLGERHGIRSHGVCILDPRWRLDETTLREVAHSRIAIDGRLTAAWVDPVIAAIQEQRPDLIMTHGFNAHFVAWLALRRARLRCPVVCSYHGPYHAARWRMRLPGFCYERFTEFFFRRHARAVVTVAEHARRRLVRRGVAVDKITVIPNALEPLPAEESAGTARAHWRRAWGIADDELLVGAIGRLDPVKGQGDLLRAFAQLADAHPRARLLLVGDGPDRSRLTALAGRGAGAARVHLAGNVAAAAQTLPALDVFVLPSHSECHSIALLEAMRAGCAVVATAVGGNVESIAHGRDGLLVPPADPAALAEALARLLGDTSLRHTCGANARARFGREFTQDLALERTARWLRDCGREAA